MIAHKIFSIWLNDSTALPPLIRRCLATHHVEGYSYKLYTLEDIEDKLKKSRYLRECVSAKRWAKAVDFLRIWILFEEGGIYLDADVEMIEGKNFEEMLPYEIFCGREKNNFVSNAIIGAESGHFLLSNYIDTVQNNFLGDGDLVFQPGMYLWTEMIHNNPSELIKVYEPEFFLPYNWQANTMEQTENTRCIHWFSRSWV